MSAPSQPASQTPRVGIIGTGFGGLAAAIELKRAGYEDLVIFEKGDEVGGVWRENTYPGAACDVPSPYYSLSYEPNRRWPRRFSQQPAILDYLKGVADKYDVRRHIRFNTEVVSASYNEADGSWSLRTGSGGEDTVDVLVSAVGQLSRPAVPVIKGSETFAGPTFHSATWDHSVDLAGKRVAVIGTGASAIQFVPEIAAEVAHLDVYQRSAPYLMPRPDAAYGKKHHALFEKVPVVQLAERGAWFGLTETLGTAFLYSKPLAKAITAASRAHMKHQTKAKPGLFEKVWPSYPVGCKRILFSSDYLPALARDNVEVIDTGIVEITPEGVVTSDGEVHQADVIVYGTGFKATEFLSPMRITGRGGADLHEHWAGGARAYLGMSVPAFPDLFLMYGPNTNLGSGSIVMMLESQARYLAQYLTHLQASRAVALDVRPEVEMAYDEEIQNRLAGAVWTQCSSWYTNANGRVVSNWPQLSIEYKRRVATFEPDDYQVLEPAAAAS